jgi:uncharacterized protein YcbK (DUF882 family)
MTASKAEPYFDNSGSVVFDSDKVKPTKKYKKTYKKQNNSSSKVASPKAYKKDIRVSNENMIVFRGHRMPKSVSEKLIEVEKIFGKISIISGCRPGATIKNTNRPSMHSFCRAVDFNPRKGTYNKVAQYLKNTWWGGVGTYSGYFNHIHIDNNRGRWHN